MLERCADRYLGTEIEVDYFSCNACGLVQQSPLPADTRSLYDSYPVHSRKSRAYAAVRRIIMNGAYCKPSHWVKGTKMLDYGCGDGWYLEWCKESGHNVVGFERAPVLAARIEAEIGVRVFSEELDLLNAHRDSFDLITLHFVVEHLADFASEFSLFSQLLRPGGLIRFVVPNIDSWEYRLFGKFWHSLDAPRHISFPDSRHAKIVAEQHSLLFDSYEHVAFPNGFAGSIPTAFLGHFSLFGMFLALPLATLVTRAFPAGNSAIYLRKPTR
jgi:SAM-dependent methyltransferase